MNRKHHSGVFMMEMIAVVFFFILCAGICIQTFVKADSMSKKAADLNQAVLIAQSVAEVWKKEGAEGLLERLEAEDQGEVYAMAFDQSGDPGKEEAVFFVQAQTAEPGRLEITVSRQKQELFTLSVRSYEKKE